MIHLLGIAAQTPSPSPGAGVPGANIFSSPVLLSISIWVPVIVAAAIAVMPNPRGRYDTLMKQIAFFTNLGIFFVLFIAYNQFQNFLPTAQFEEKYTWMPAIGVTYHLGVDGPSIVMLMLSGLVGIASVLASVGIRERVRSYFALMLLAQAAVNGAIASRDMFLFILFWSAAIVPMALLVLGWGGPRRTGATWRLLGYWGAGTIALVIGTMVLYGATNGTSFDMDVLLKATVSPRIQIAVAALMILAGATRLPLFPFHGWMRDVGAEAPAGVAVLVAGATSRLGAYLILRVVIGALPAGAQILSPVVAALAALTVGYAAVAALRSVDVRQTGAYLALIPGGVTALGLVAVSPLGIAGSVLSMFAGGLAAALMVGVCATLAERAQSRSLLVIAGVAPRMPLLTWLMILAVLGVLGVPVLATFPALLMTFFGAFKTQPIGAFAVVIGLAVAAVAAGILLRRVLFGAPNPDAPGVSDVAPADMWYLAVLAGALLWVGVFPAGPKIPGTDSTVFDPGLVNQMAAGLSDMAGPYTLPTPSSASTGQ